MSTSQRARVPVHVPAMLDMVLRSVMYVPPILGSLILALNAIIDTNIEYTKTWKKGERGEKRIEGDERGGEGRTNT